MRLGRGVDLGQQPHRLRRQLDKLAANCERKLLRSLREVRMVDKPEVCVFALDSKPCL